MKTLILARLGLVAALLASAVTSAMAAPILRFQGRLIDLAGNGLQGSIFVRYRTAPSLPSHGSAIALGRDGKFDFTYDASTRTEVALVYYPPEMSPGPADADRRIDEILSIDLEEGAEQWFVGANRQPAQPIPGGYNWCGAVFQIYSYLDPSDDYQTVDPRWIGNLSWCPDASGKEPSTQITRMFPQGNLISNSSFENNYEAGAPSLYEKWNTSGLQNDDASWGNLRPHTGKKMAAITYTAPATPWGGSYAEYSFLHSEYYPVKPNTKYLLTFYYSTKNAVSWGTHGVRPMVKTFSERDGGAEVFDMLGGRHGATAYSSSPDAWVRYMHPFETGPTANFSRIELLRTNDLGAGGTFYFDDVTIVEQSSLDLDRYEVGEEAHQALRIGSSTIFADGLNRSFLVRGQDVDGKQVYSHTEHDVLHRPFRSALPVSIQDFQSSNGGYLHGIQDSAIKYYDGGTYADADGRAFSEVLHDNTPLGRLKEQAAPGYLWRPGAGHTSRKFYSSTADTSGSIADEPSLASTGSAKYSYILSRGEDGELSRDFEDKFGNVVRSSNTLGGSWIHTDYRYDANGNLDTVIAPAGPGGTRQVTASRFNALGMKLSDSAGDYGVVRYVYDPSGRLRFSQSQSQRNTHKFSYVKYDAFDRIVESGEHLDAGDFTEQYAAVTDFPTSSHPHRRLRTKNYYDKVPEPAPDCFDNKLPVGVYVIRPGSTDPDEYDSFMEAYADARSALAGMTSYSPDTVRFIHILESSSWEVTPEDPEYTAIPLLENLVIIPFTIRAVPLYQYLADETSEILSPPEGVTWGTLKGRLTKTVTCNEALRNTEAGLKPVAKFFNYDKYGNASAVYEYNGYLDDENRWRKSTMRYDALNRVLEKTRYNDMASDTLYEATLRYSYDVAGRVDTVRNGNDLAVLINVYNELGRLTLQYPNPDEGIRIEYSYHLRGWPTSIGVYNSADQTLFSQTLAYEDGTNPTYNGNISEYSTIMEGDESSYGYYFLYDDLNRLVHAETERNSGGADGEWDFAYHANGSIDEMERHGQTFDYVYNTGKNQLDKVTHTGSTPPRNASATDNFQYDADGRMISDASKRLTVTYDEALDRPYKLLLKDGSGNPLKAYYMVYDASGNRVSKLEYTEDATWANSKHYFGNGEEVRESYTAGPTSIYSMDGIGRLLNMDASWVIETYLKNHLGSTVMVYRNGTDLYRTDYEPYGKPRGESEASEPLTQKFTTKELDDGIELTYFGARYYDQDLGVWTSPDPSRQFHSPYSYTGNGYNPITGVDRDGREINFYHRPVMVGPFEVGRHMFAEIIDPYTGAKEYASLEGSAFGGGTKLWMGAPGKGAWGSDVNSIANGTAVKFHTAAKADPYEDALQNKAFTSVFRGLYDFFFKDNYPSPAAPVLPNSGNSNTIIDMGAGAINHNLPDVKGAHGQNSTPSPNR